MQSLVPIESLLSGDNRLLASVSASMTEAARRGGSWIVCRPGCAECCIGPFAITGLDALRLRDGLRTLADSDPDRAAAVRARASEYVRKTAAVYPGNIETGELCGEDSLPDSMDELPCPALDPTTGTCDLYAARPITCRTFGPVTRVGDGSLAACELCYGGATEEEMAACAVDPDPDGIECELLASLAERGITGTTIVAWALTRY